MRKYLFLLFCIFFTKDVCAQTQETLNKIEEYLNNIKSMEATFVQMASNGATAEGRLFIKKPNKIRMEYAEPTNVLIVGDGNFIVYNDLDLDQVTHIDYKDIPASLILSNKVKIDNKNFKIIDFYQDSGSTSITLEHLKSNDVGAITLVFANSPLELKQWKIVDPQSVEVTVSLYDTKIDNDINDDVFKFKNKKKNSRNFKKK